MGFKVLESQAAGIYILCRVVEEPKDTEEVTKGGILIAEVNRDTNPTKPRPMVGVIESIGSLVDSRLGLVVGLTVTFPPFAGHRIPQKKDPRGDLVFIKDSEILGQLVLEQ